MRERFDSYTLLRPKTRKTVGWLLVVFGLAGIILPIVPGWLPFFVGLEILGLQFVFVAKLKKLFSRKFTPATEVAPSEKHVG